MMKSGDATTGSARREESEVGTDTGWRISIRGVAIVGRSRAFDNPTAD
jgi:hypothetical protein